MAANQQLGSRKHDLAAAAHERPCEKQNNGDESNKKRYAKPEKSGGGHSEGSASNSSVQTSARVIFADEGNGTSRLRSTLSPPSPRSTLLGMDAPFTAVPN